MHRPGRVIALTALLVAPSSLLACSEKPVFSGDGWPSPGDLPEIGAGKVLITNSGDDTVSWVDLATISTAKTAVYTQPVGLLPPEREGPHHGAVAKDFSAFFIGLSNYVPGSGSGPHGSHGLGTVDGYLLKYDARTLELLGITRVSKSPGDVRITPDGAHVLQTHYDLVKVQEWADKGETDVTKAFAPIAIIDAQAMGDATLVPACPTPHGIIPSPDSAKAYASCSTADEIAVLDIAGQSVTRVPIGATANDPSVAPTYEPYSVAITPDGSDVWVSCLKTADLRILHTADGTWDTTRGPIATGGPPFFGTFNKAGTYFFVATQGSNTFLVIDAVTGEIKVTLPMATEACYLPHAVVLTPDEKRALVVCEGDHAAPDISPGTLAVVNLANPLTPTLENAITVGIFPDDAFILQ